jgi:ribosome-associated protein
MAQTKTLQRQIAELTLSRKAKDVVIMDLRKVTTMADYFVVCTGESETQVRAIADAVMEGMSKVGEKPWHSEGLQNLQWVLLDYVDVVVHVFHKEARAFYGLEKLWGDAKIQKVADRKPRGVKTASKDGGARRDRKQTEV